MLSWASLMSSPFSSRHFPDVLVVEFHRDALEETAYGNLAESLLDLLHQAKTARLHLNFGGVRSVAEHVWLELIDLNTYLQEAGCHLGLLNLSPSLLQQLRTLQQPEPVAAL